MEIIEHSEHVGGDVDGFHCACVGVEIALPFYVLVIGGVIGVVAGGAIVGDTGFAIPSVFVGDYFTAEAVGGLHCGVELVGDAEDSAFPRDAVSVEGGEKLVAVRAEGYEAVGDVDIDEAPTIVDIVGYFLIRDIHLRFRDESGEKD